MSSDYDYFVGLVKSVDSLDSAELRKEIVSRPVEFWDPEMFWDWKQAEENYQAFAHFMVLSTRSLSGGERNEIPITLISNLHVTIPWCYENVAELCMLLLEEFAYKKILHVRALLHDIEENFAEHPDFSERKEELFSDFNRYRSSLESLQFAALSENWIDRFHN